MQRRTIARPRRPALAGLGHTTTYWALLSLSWAAGITLVFAPSPPLCTGAHPDWWGAVRVYVPDWPDPGDQATRARTTSSGATPAESLRTKRPLISAVLGRAGRPAPLTQRGHLDRPARWPAPEQADPGDRIRPGMPRPASVPGRAAGAAPGGRLPVRWSRHTCSLDHK